ncbi:MAG: dipeptide/oligopeptide/nickel ABC transporter ATP-binding protein [Myxococcota bacterium]|nr:dipeptide/oligopeptide/nickel ABC transporter ATP-binding protein [Myxococcota bacterium]
MNTALDIKALQVRFGGLLTSEVTAVHSADLQLHFGEVLGLIGESGSGKTSLVRAALGLGPRSGGSVSLLGQDPAALRGAPLRRLRTQAQMLFQDPDSMLNPGLTVHQHLLESARLHQPQRDPEHLIGKILRQVGLEQRLHALPSQLSGGEKRRAGIARVLLAEPRVLIADEPTAGLDAALRAEMVGLILAERGPERAHLLVSHDLPLVAYACDRVAVMLEGRIVERLPASALRQAEHPYTRQLLRHAGMLG